MNVKGKECDFVEAGKIILELFEISNRCNSLNKILTYGKDTL